MRPRMASTGPTIDGGAKEGEPAKQYGDDSPSPRDFPHPPGWPVLGNGHSPIVGRPAPGDGGSPAVSPENPGPSTVAKYPNPFGGRFDSPRGAKER